jgi:hypothetical protein
LATYIEALVFFCAKARNRSMDTAERLSKVTAAHTNEIKVLEAVKWWCAKWTTKSFTDAIDTFNRRWPRALFGDYVRKAFDLEQQALHLKANVTPGTTTDTGFAASLAATRPLETSVAEWSRPASLVGKLLTVGAREVPLNTSLPVQLAGGGGTYRWQSQAGPSSVGQLSFSTATIPPAAAGGLLAVTEELLKLSTPASVTFLRDELKTGLNFFLDQQLTDPAVAAVAGVSPASITNAGFSFGSAGTSSGNVLTDFKAGVAQHTTMNLNARSIVLLTSPRIAVALAVAAETQTPSSARSTSRWTGSPRPASVTRCSTNAGSRTSRLLSNGATRSDRACVIDPLTSYLSMDAGGLAACEKMAGRSPAVRAADGLGAPVRVRARPTLRVYVN